MIIINALTMKVQTTIAMLFESTRDFKFFKVGQTYKAIRNCFIRRTVPSSVYVPQVQ